MGKWYLVPASILAVAILVSCATAKGAPTAEPAQIEPAAEIAPVMVEQAYWVLNRVETAYPDGVISAVEEFALDGTGRVLKNAVYDGKGAKVSEKAYVWNGDTVTFEMTDASGSPVGKGTQEWANGFLMKETRLTAKDEIQSTEEYAYDADGNKIRWSVQTAKGNTVSSVYTWEAGRLAAISVKDATGAEIKRFARVFDADGALLAEEEYDGAGTLLRKISYKYEGGFVTGEEVRNASGGLISSIAYVNDANGNHTTVNYLDRTGRLIESRKQAWSGFTRLVRQK